MRSAKSLEMLLRFLVSAERSLRTIPTDGPNSNSESIPGTRESSKRRVFVARKPRSWTGFAKPSTSDGNKRGGLCQNPMSNGKQSDKRVRRLDEPKQRNLLPNPGREKRASFALRFLSLVTGAEERSRVVGVVAPLSSIEGVGSSSGSFVRE